MADPVVHITNGVPDSGTGNITTLGQTLVDGANVTIGAKADARSTATDTTAVSAMSVWKQISFSIQALVTAFGAAWTRGSGVSDANTQRVTIATDQLGALAASALAMSSGYQLVALPTDQRVPNTLQSQTNGTTSSRVNAAASTNATNLKASAGSLVNIDVFNVAAYSVFLKIYNKASSPTVGTDTPVWTIPIAAGTGYARTFPAGKWLSTGVSYAITKLQADSDTTAVAAGDLTGSIDWI